MKFILNFILIVFIICAFLSCGNTNSISKNEDKIHLRFKMEEIYFNDSLHPDKGEVFGIISINPGTTRISISLNDASINDSIFNDNFKKLPLLNEVHIIKMNYIDYAPLFVSNLHNLKNWKRLRVNKANLFYFYGSYSKQYRSKDVLYFDCPVKINNSIVNKKLKYSVNQKVFY